MIYVWTLKKQIINIGSDVSLSEFIEDKNIFDEEINQLIYKKSEKEASPLVSCENSIVKLITKNAIFSFRLYILFQNGDESKRDSIADFIEEEINNH